jgi:hypothetical protein
LERHQVTALQLPAESAIRDLEARTLASLHGDVSKVVYLSATRDYNTGQYHHEGLVLRFGETAAQTALAKCHEAVFQDLLHCGMEALVAQLAAYIESTGADRERVLDNWRRLEAYRVLIPGNCNPLSADCFITNIKIALEVLRLGAPPAPGN